MIDISLREPFDSFSAPLHRLPLKALQQYLADAVKNPWANEVPEVVARIVKSLEADITAIQTTLWAHAGRKLDVPAYYFITTAEEAARLRRRLELYRRIAVALDKGDVGTLGSAIYAVQHELGRYRGSIPDHIRPCMAVLE